MSGPTFVDNAWRAPNIAVARWSRYAAMDRTRTFAIILEPEEEGGFTVRVPALPEIVTYGNDEAEALAMAEDAIRLVLEDLAARGEPLPDSESPRLREVKITLAA